MSEARSKMIADLFPPLVFRLLRLAPCLLILTTLRDLGGGSSEELVMSRAATGNDENVAQDGILRYVF